MSDTPKTDAFIDGLNDDWDVEFAALTSHAKQLERDLNKARQVAEQMSESNEVLLADIHHYREQLKGASK
jgi:hypothetical protein